ncbi:MAG: OmpA family protein [Pseudomonadota bacterium]
MRMCAAGGLVASLWVSSAWAVCDPLQEADEILSTLDEKSSTALSTLRESALQRGCTGSEQQQIGRWLSLSLLYDAARSFSSLEEAEPSLRRAAAFGGIWQVHNALGDAARARRDYDEAALQYQLAIQDAQILADPSSSYLDVPPGEDAMTALVGKANDMRLLASGFVTLPGRPACQIQTTSLWTAQIVAPIRFVTNETTMTDEGKSAADELYSCLAALDPANIESITIIGHTDERGSDSYNQALSLRRAEAVKTYLVDRGLRLDMGIEGRGEEELFQPDTSFAYSEEERWQMSRRVEVDVVERGS